MDVVQLVWASFFARAAARQYELDDPKRVLNLLITLAHNKLLDQAKGLRRKRRGEGQLVGGLPGTDELIDPRPGPEQEAGERDLVETFRRCLPPRAQGLWDQRILGRSWAEIAAESGADPDAPRIYFNRALERVARQMNPG
jgi:DNA-directed RNA polymerase specialized sigma24 family protein